MAPVFGVSKAVYYAWIHLLPLCHSLTDEALLKRVQTVHASSQQAYGATRLPAESQDRGAKHGRKRISRPLRSAELVGASHRHGGPVKTRRDEEARPSSDLVDRRITAPGSDQLLIADITYVQTAAGFLYLAFVLNAWSREIVGRSVANHLRAELVLAPVEMAIWLALRACLVSGEITCWRLFVPRPMIWSCCAHPNLRRLDAACVAAFYREAVGDARSSRSRCRRSAF